MYYQRTAEQTLKRLAKEFPCVVVYGPRQCGKSTLVQTLFSSQYEFVTLDDMDELSLALSNPKLFWTAILFLSSSMKYRKHLRFSLKSSFGLISRSLYG